MTRKFAPMVTLLCLAIALIGCNTQTTDPQAQTKEPGASYARTTNPNQSQEPLLTLEVTDGTIDVLDYSLIPEDSVAEFSLLLDLQGNIFDRYVLRLEYDLATDPIVSATATLLDQQGDLLWQYVFEGSTADPSWKRIQERTTSDEMTITHFELGDSIVECYELNGASAQFTYSSALAEKVSSGLIDELTPTEQIEYTNLQDEFLSFYSASGTLNDNAYGRVVTELLSSPRFAVVLGEPVAQYDLTRPLAKKVSRLEFICALAGICTTVKCLFGALLNPLCDACGGTAIACALATIFLFLFPSH